MLTRYFLITTTLSIAGLIGCVPVFNADPNSINQPIFNPDLTQNPDANTPQIDYGDVVIAGMISTPEAGQMAPGQDAYTVFVASDTTGEIFTADVNDNGSFSVDLPDEEAGNTFTVTVADGFGKSLGPVLFDDLGSTGLTPVGTANLGEIVMPLTPGSAPIVPGSNANTGGMIATTIQTRLDPDGVPVGVSSWGKGDDAELSGPVSGKADIDRDGLISIFDADDDGDGVVDDFDPSGSSPLGEIRVNFFMNLKIAAEDAHTYYMGSGSEIEARRATDTIITFEVVDDDPNSGVELSSVTMYPSPGPSYLSGADLMTDDGGGLTYSPWSDSSYAFEPATDRYQAFVRPNDLMEAGDTFRISLSFAGGAGYSTWRMINFVFTNIPKLIKYGSPLGTTPFDITNPTINGTAAHPIRFDSSKDLVLEFEPPVDETGSPLTDLPEYNCQIFYLDSNGDQLNGNIDVDATFSPLPSGATSNLAFVVDASTLSLSANGTYTITVPKELFPSSVTLMDSTSEPISAFKIDLTAESDGGNAAIMLNFKPF
jgi:hypothetical protein